MQNKTWSQTRTEALNPHAAKKKLWTLMIYVIERKLRISSLEKDGHNFSFSRKTGKAN